MGAEALHLLRWGDDGTPILLTHGLASNAAWWLKVGASLGARHRAVALDFAGHGDSAWRSSYTPQTYVADIEEARHSLGWERMILVGHSMGGRVSAEYAARHPERVAGLVLVDFWPEAYDRKALADKLKGRGQPVYPDADKMAERFHLEPAETTLTPAELKALGARCVKRWEGGYTWKFDWKVFDARFEAVWPLAKQIKAPACIVRGEKSKVMSPEAFARLGKEVPGARVVELAGSYHHVPLDAPDLLAALIADVAAGLKA